MYITEWAKKNYERTEDAVLVSKWFGGFDPFKQFIVQGREAELLAFAQKLEREEKATKGCENEAD